MTTRKPPTMNQTSATGGVIHLGKVSCDSFKRTVLGYDGPLQPMGGFTLPPCSRSCSLKRGWEWDQLNCWPGINDNDTLEINTITMKKIWLDYEYSNKLKGSVTWNERFSLALFFRGKFRKQCVDNNKMCLLIKRISNACDKGFTVEHKKTVKRLLISSPFY